MLCEAIQIHAQRYRLKTQIKWTGVNTLNRRDCTANGPFIKLKDHALFMPLSDRLNRTRGNLHTTHFAARNVKKTQLLTTHFQSLLGTLDVSTILTERTRIIFT